MDRSVSIDAPDKEYFCRCDGLDLHGMLKLWPEIIQSDSLEILGAVFHRSILMIDESKTIQGKKDVLNYLYLKQPDYLVSDILSDYVRFNGNWAIAGGRYSSVCGESVRQMMWILHKEKKNWRLMSMDFKLEPGFGTDTEADNQ